ncbi:MAG: methionine synthase [Acidobacteriota bacterium]|nr:methionine synthase [Acidobacteriota bacterium]
MSPSAKSSSAYAYPIQAPAEPPPEPADREARTAALLSALEERILVLDGATGTAMQSVELTADHFGGPDLEGCNEMLCLISPQVVDGVHESYLAAGADIVETNTFGGTPLVLAEYDQAHRAYEINRVAAEIARGACARHDRPGRTHFVCGSIGPTTKAISVTGGVTFQELVDNFRLQAQGLMAGGADYLLVETCQDTRNIKAALLGLEQAFEWAGWRIPVAVSATIEPTGTMLAGQDAEALAVSLLHADLLYVGLNCATGPGLMADHLRTLSELCRTRVACVPNAGLPDEEGQYQEGPEHFREVFGRFLDSGWLNLVGGCCGTTAEHVSTLAELVADYRPRRIPVHQRPLVSGLEAVELTADNRPLLVGERTNVLGSRKFKRLIAAGEIEQAAEIGRGQVKAGAQIVDVCLQDPDRDELRDMELFLDQLMKLIKVPVMIDSTDAEVMERSLTYCQGKAILNSINLEDGRSRFEAVVPLAQRFGAALVVGLIDEQGMAVSVERKMEVAHRSYRILTEEMGVAPEDIWWDALVFPCGTGDEAYLGSAAGTIEGVRRLKAELPHTRTILGVSNVSFGLPTAGREVLNSVFLYHATRAGLDTAIVNTQRLARYAEIPEEERKLAEALIFLDPGDVAGGDAAVEAFTAHFRDRSAMTPRQPREELELAERIARSVVEGSKIGLEDDLAQALEDERWPEPLAIINGPLMDGMKEVGRLFNDNQLIVAEVLQSAEVMKAAVAFLEPHMERSDGSSRGKVLLATVKGDVHDIGKNLVDIILSNNGFEVVNLGIKVPSEVLIQAVEEHRPDVLGLSGLLVKSAQQMVTSAGDLQAAGISVPMLVGGAALTRRFTHKKIAPAYGALCTYAKDAMNGLRLVERLLEPSERVELEREVAEQAAADQAAEAPGKGSSSAGPRRQVAVSRDVDIPRPPDLGRHSRELDLDEVWALLNPQMLFAKHLGLKGSVAKLAAAGDEKYRKLERLMDELKDFCRGGGMSCQAAWRFYPARAEGNTLMLLEPDSDLAAARWELPRQDGDGLCLTDYVLDDDHVAVFVTTAGAGVREQVEEWKQQGEYLKSHGLAALALETAEAAAEWVHRELRRSWGVADPEGLSPKDLFACRYRGKRYSFGYPACPDLGGQRQLFAALAPEDIGVELTDGDMMDPEASVSALVFHHPEARYFGV